MTRAPRRLARLLRDLPDRLLHPLRRRRARRRLSALGASPRGGVGSSPGEPFRILFVCAGNICRSPYAAGALERELPPWLADRVVVSSAGFFEPHRSSPPEAVEMARSRGVELSPHRSRAISAELVGEARLVLVMERAQARRVARLCRRDTAVLLLGDLDPLPVPRRRIEDPFARPPEVFERVFDQIDRCVVALLDALATPGKAASERVPGEAAGR